MNQLQNLLSLSPFVKRISNQNPEINDLIHAEFNLQEDWTGYKKQHAHLDVFALLRNYRQSRLALIAIKDCFENNKEDHLKTLNQVSILAKLLINHAYEYALSECEKKYGTLMAENDDKQSFVIYALGKLGGNELNYSSDVDLVFCYTGSGQSNGTKSIDAQSYYNRLGRRIIQILDSMTQHGIVYRVDMRLRPFGSASPLTCTTSNLINYLESEGRDWERYAWLRASFVAGNENIAINTLKQIEPFIYRKYLDFSIFESLRQIKSQITRKQQDDHDNLKLGYGGIREIEFIIQTLQITFGGRNKQLRGNDLWQQMHNLCEFNHINTSELKKIKAAWLFLRKVENLCQIINDRDTHHLPKDNQNLALCMGMNSTTALLEDLKTHRDHAHSIFDHLFLHHQNNSDVELQRIHPKIQAIKDDISTKNYPKTTKHKIYCAFDAITPLLSQFNSQDEIIQRFQQVVFAVSKRLSYLSMLIESPLILNKLLTQISHGSYFSNAIAKTPSLLELLFDSINESDFETIKQWQTLSNKHDVNGVESLLELLVQFKKRQQFLVVVAYIDQIHSAKKSNQILSELAEFILYEVIKAAYKETQKQVQSTIQENDLIVIAYGSLAMKTMHLNSDFDLVFILAQEINVNNHKFVMRWIKRIIHFLSVQCYSGNLYQLDTQLRPNGKSGAASVSQTNFENYQKKQAWTWEHAALIKTRVVYATDKQTTWYLNLRKEILTQERQKNSVISDLKHMSEKMKKLNKNHQNEFGKLADVLINANKNPELIDNCFGEYLKISKEKLNQSIS